MIIRNFNTDDQVLVVAEIGNNHEGDFGVAEELVRKAAQCKVDAVKFQTFKTENFVSRSDTARFERLKSFELTPEEFGELSALAHTLGLLFISTPLDLGSVTILEPLVDVFKIASGDNTFYPLIGQVARTGKPMIVSTGIADGDVVQQAVDFIKAEWKERGVQGGQLALLHCVTAYPTPHEQVNLRSIAFLAEKFPELTIGYSDHTDGIEAAVLSVALGARIIEEHFTLDKQFSEFRDHQLSSDPMDMTKVITQIREAERMLGQKAKSVMPAEADMPALIRRSIVAAHGLPKGYV
ncbi:MAG TPA: N-acetylneuraminate synthase family protein, partial [Candidatus Andersenbacteria bacterium]|nr:N-acetylneuraminate synthase family protein [Candidatus Andersenbacteria bacterium]